MSHQTQSLLAEACDRLAPAAKALKGLASLLGSNTDAIDSEALYYLLSPIEIEVNAALDTILLARQPAKPK